MYIRLWLTTYLLAGLTFAHKGVYVAMFKDQQCKGFISVANVWENTCATWMGGFQSMMLVGTSDGQPYEGWVNAYSRNNCAGVGGQRAQGLNQQSIGKCVPDFNAQFSSSLKGANALGYFDARGLAEEIGEGLGMVAVDVIVGMIPGLGAGLAGVVDSLMVAARAAGVGARVAEAAAKAGFKVAEGAAKQGVKQGAKQGAKQVAKKVAKTAAKKGAKKGAKEAVKQNNNNNNNNNQQQNQQHKQQNPPPPPKGH